MRSPRLRFTIRRFMVAVAVAAFALVLVPPSYHRLVWLYNTPPTTSALFAAGVNPAPSPRPAGQRRPWQHPVGRPYRVQADYNTSLLPRVPGGLPYKVRVEIKLMDHLRKGTVFESHRTSFFLLAGDDSRNEGRGRFACDLTPRGPGQYVVRYEVWFTDVFGREAMGACHTGGFQAQ